MFGDERNYGDYGNGQKVCPLCNLPVRISVKCDGCQRDFCRSHKDQPFTKEWYCPDCTKNFEIFMQPLKTSNVDDFFKKLG